MLEKESTVTGTAPSSFTMSKMERLVWIAVLFLLTTGLVRMLFAGVDTADGLFVYGAPGTIDFFQYWAGFKALMSGTNPYSPEAAAAAYETVRHQTSQEFVPIVMRNPPWLLILLAPVLWPSFQVAATLWMAANILLMLGAGYVFWRAIRQPGDSFLPACVASVLFIPAWSVLYWGQLGLLLTLGAAGLYWGLVRRRDALAALFLVLLTVKPHLFLLLGVALMWHIVQQRRWLILGYFGLWLSGLVAITLVLDPQVLWEWVSGLGYDPAQWLESSRGTGQNIVVYSVADSPTPAFPNVIGMLIKQVTGEMPNWPVIAIPLGAAAILAIGLYRRWLFLDWRRHFVPILALSLFLAPYAWFHDFSMLLVAQVGVLAYSARQTVPKEKKLAVWLAIVAINTAILVQANTQLAAQYYYFWVPVAYAGLVLAWQPHRYQLG